MAADMAPPHVEPVRLSGWALVLGASSGFGEATSLALARAAAKLIVGDPMPAGVRHIFSDDLSKCELLSRLARAFGHRVDVKPVRAAVSRDRRLRTSDAEFLKACALPKLDEQLEELPRFADRRGRWLSAL